MKQLEFLNPDIWKISDEKYEDTYLLVPIDVNRTILGSVEKGFPQNISCDNREYLKKYFDNITPEKEKWVQMMCFNCGAAYIMAVKGGLSYERASAVSTKFISMSQKTQSKSEFVEMTLFMYETFATEVQKIKQIRTDHPIVNRAMAFIEDHPDNRLTVKAVAEDCGCSLSSLQHIFTHHTGMSVSAYIRKKKVEKACFLLDYTDMSSTKIAQKLSYSSQSYFIQQFQSETGITPNQYRKRKI